MRLMVECYPQFLRSPLGTPGTMIHHLVRTHEKKKDKERLHFQSLVAKASSTKKKLFKEEKEKKDLILGPCTICPLNILHFLFYIQKQKKPIHTLIFLFLLKNLPMQNLNLCKTHRLCLFIYVRKTSKSSNLPKLQKSRSV